MEFNEYQKRIRDFAKYPKAHALEYLALGLNGEAGEVAEKVKKLIRDGVEPGTEQDWNHALLRELGDALWYLSELAYLMGHTLDEVATTNIEKLESRQKRNMLGGSGDNR